MKFLLLISIRNLLRQKRRNLLLGSAMAIGMAVLVIANAFSHGISDVMFNRILTYVTGHVSVAFTVKGNLNSQIFRDGERMLALARRRLPAALRVDEAVGVFTRAVGNGVSDNIILIGMDVRSEATEKEKAELRDNFPMVEGTFEDVIREDLENPVLLADEKAAYLKVKRGDVLRARYQDVFGRNQAVRLTVAGIFKPSNIFMTAPVFMDLHRLKALAGYGPHDISGFHITLPDPEKQAVPSADSLHAALAPPLASAYGRLVHGNPLPARHRAGFQGGHRIPEGPGENPGAAAGRRRVPRKSSRAPTLADSLGLRPGAVCTLIYAAKHGTQPGHAAVFKVTGAAPPVRRPARQPPPRQRPGLLRFLLQCLAGPLRLRLPAGFDPFPPSLPEPGVDAAGAHGDHGGHAAEIPGSHPPEDPRHLGGRADHV